MPGAIALEKLQAGLEATRGTAVPATRKVYGERGTAWWDPTVKKEFLAESMGSYVKNYRHVVLEQSGKLTIPFYVTASDLAWWGQLFWKGGVTGVLSAVTVYTYTFAPTVASDDLKTATFEAHSDTQDFQIPFCLADKLEISWTAGGIVKATAELLGQQYIAQAITGAITDRTALNGMAGTTAQVFIDNAGGTMGTTPFASNIGGKITYINDWMPITHNKNQLFYDDAARGTRSVQLELDMQYNTNAELAHLADDAERLIRVQFSGPVIAGSTGNVLESVKNDFYGFHTDGAYSVNKNIRMLKMMLESQYDTSAGTDFSVAIANSNSTLP